ncbi:UDP-N-acetylmuramoyl-tripeptide--D-alanyl-D-alanine ligase [Desmospora profundinema]|uniref:UDP-N-acetylmuramoyl-tripeptide--D-alanyl-D-alanine ligase n=1 Tax=Desmospora profundinema TaxID=1571184 RepID=A0ABU1IJ67_9BACL|nr:UDP-N-acetylmuramoyl-tripeptide--D-alanyl-D-alanine ligase [Desmospora profundinema]MDR6224803.1 UDP-N-acetylmuramoyl-tripeptide--D-alanyl-D-alanine ligase [Desmospora profundinema]
MRRTLHDTAKMARGDQAGPSGNPMVTGVSTDTRTLEPGQLYVPLEGERFDGHDFLKQAVEKGASAALWERSRPLPETSIPLVLVDDTLEALQRLASAYRQAIGATVVAVTGSNGKTTTKDLIGSVLGIRYRVHRTRGNLNNHIGVPLTLLSMPEETEVAVVEMGMNHAGEIALLSRMAVPDLAVVTNVGDAHLEFLGSRAGIADAKLEILEGLKPGGILVHDGDEPLLEERLRDETRKRIPVGFGKDNTDPIGDLVLKGEEGIAFCSSSTGYRFHLSLPGRHNAMNAMMAIAIGRQFNLSDQEIQQGFNRVKASGMRLERLIAVNGMTIINDAYNASPRAMMATIDLLVSLPPERKKWVLFGDILELGDEEKRYHQEVGAYAVKQGVDRIFTLGRRGRWIAEGAQKAGADATTIHCRSAEDAAERLLQMGDETVTLLVKASRGARLEAVVQQLVKGEKAKSDGY